MNDELTAVDIRKMQEELEYRRIELRPKLIEDVKTAREFGDLSENFEYKSAKREKNRNDSRIRYLERMIKTAKVIDVRSNADEIGPVSYTHLPQGEIMKGVISRAGFSEVNFRRLTFGICTLYTATK